MWGHAFFERAAFGAIEMFIELADAAKAKADADAKAASSADKGDDEVGAAERKKAASKARKAAAKAAADATKKEAEEKEAAAKADKESGVAKKKQQPKVGLRAVLGRGLQPHLRRGAGRAAASSNLWLRSGSDRASALSSPPSAALFARALFSVRVCLGRWREARGGRGP